MQIHLTKLPWLRTEIKGFHLLLNLIELGFIAQVLQTITHARTMVLPKK